MRPTTRKPLPAFSRMSIEPAMLEFLYSELSERPATRILELGSGLSTVAMAYMVEASKHGHIDALEHDGVQRLRTQEWLHEHELAHLATVHYAPIRNQRVEWDGGTYPWYDVSVLPADARYDFVFVDGPPANIGHLARWPAYHLLRRHFVADCRIVADDTNRAQERVTVEHWLKHDDRLKRTDLVTSRGGVLLERSLVC